MKNRKAAWWQLFALLFILAVLFLLEYRDPIPGVSPDAVDIAVFVLFVGGAALWINRNGQALRSYGVPEDELRTSMVVKVYENGRPANVAARLSEPGYLLAEKRKAVTRAAQKASLEEQEENLRYD